MKKTGIKKASVKFSETFTAVLTAVMLIFLSVPVCGCRMNIHTDTVYSSPLPGDIPAVSQTAENRTSLPVFTPEPVSTSEPVSTPEPPSYIEKILSEMTLEEKIGQLFFVLPEALRTSGSGKADVLTAGMKAALKKYPAGGILLAGNNISSPKQLEKFINDLQDASSIPLFIGMDEEGGNIVRIAGCKNFHVETFPPMLEIGRTGNPANAYRAGFAIGGYLKEYGVNLDLAPVADLFTDPHNRVIGSRCFGSDPELVSSMVAAQIRGFHAQGIMTCAKHFPGHGNTAGDTHFGFVKTDRTWQELSECELIPFQSAIDSGSDMIMAAHISAPLITGNTLPASLSHTLITEKLRNEMGFDGVVITDSMAMQAITDSYSPREAAVKSIQAGADIILSPDDYEEAFKGLYQAVKSGRIDEKRIDRSVLRILALKEEYIFPEHSGQNDCTLCEAYSFKAEPFIPNSYRPF